MAEERRPTTRDLASLLNGPPPRPSRPPAPPAPPTPDRAHGLGKGLGALIPTEAPTRPTTEPAPSPATSPATSPVASPAARPVPAPDPASRSAGGRGGQHVMTLCLSEEAFRVLEARVRASGHLVREVVIGAVNLAYEHLRARTPAPTVPVGVIPLVVRSPRRRLPDHGRRKPVRFAPEEHDALVRVAAELHLSVSALVTDALLDSYGQGPGASPAAAS